MINLRTSGEKNMDLRSEEEGEIVRGKGLRYSHIPVSMDDPHNEEVDMFRHDLKTLVGPVYVHCSVGIRAAAFAIIHYAVELGLSPEAAFQKCRPTRPEHRERDHQGLHAALHQQPPAGAARAARTNSTSEEKARTSSSNSGRGWLVLPVGGLIPTAACRALTLFHASHIMAVPGVTSDRSVSTVYV